MKNISAILQRCTNTPFYKQLCYGNFEKGCKRLRLAETELADKWDAFTSLGRMVRKSIHEKDNWQEGLCSHHGDHFSFI